MLNLNIIMNFGSRKNTDKTNCIIIKTNKAERNDQAGFIIDHPGDVLDIPDNIYEPPPANYEGIESGYIKKVARMDSGLLLIIDEKTILERAHA